VKGSFINPLVAGRWSLVALKIGQLRCRFDVDLVGGKL